MYIHVLLHDWLKRPPVHVLKMYQMNMFQVILF